MTADLVQWLRAQLDEDEWIARAAVTPHRCDEWCVCPDHRTPLYYSPAQHDHACQDITCRYGHGMNGRPVARRLRIDNGPWHDRPR
jgi:hypothetical protein